MGYSDKEMTAFTQVAYMNDIEEILDNYRTTNGFADSEKIPMKLLYDYLDSDSKKKYDNIKNNLGCDIDNWCIVKTHDKNDTNGFSAYVIETSPGNAVVAFRGSDAMDTCQKVKTDWVDADIKLMNATCTKQQKEVDIFLEENKDLLNKYNLTMTGHSLGGNLAEYATIVSDRYGLDDNISQCVSLDGPGFSYEFILKHQKEIAKMSGKMKHYRWSFVGTMLNDLPGVDYKYLSISNESNLKDNKEYNDFTRHDTKYLDYDSEGNYVEGKQDTLSKITSHITEGIDHMPRIVGDVLVTVVGTVWIGAMWAKENLFNEDGKLTVTGIAVLGFAAVAIGTIGVGTVVGAVLATVAVIIGTVVVAAFCEFVYDLAMSVINFVCDTVSKIYNVAKTVINQIKESAIAFINGARDWFNKTFNAGYKYANAHPLIRLDTYKLNLYAQRLYDVNYRISGLDGRLDGLYGQVGLSDLWNLIQADLFTGYSWRLLRCAEYLNSTASDFEGCEREISGNI